MAVAAAAQLIQSSVLEPLTGLTDLISSAAVVAAAPTTVAIVIPRLALGGAERVALWLAGSLQERGHRVLLLTDGRAEIDFYPLPQGVTRIDNGSSFGGRSWPLLRNLGMLGKGIAHLRSLGWLRQQLQRQQVQTALAFLPNASVKSVLACAGLPIRVVISERSAPWLVQHPPVLKLLRRLLYRHADAQVVQTEPIAAWLRQHAGCCRVAVIPNAVQRPLPMSEPRIAPSTFVSPHRQLLLAAGTKPFQKGFDLLLEAFAAIAAQHPNWDLAIVGMATPPPRSNELGMAQLQEHARRAGLANRLHLIGPVGNIADWYARADLFVLSSRYEGIPNVLLEALAAGCACLATDCPTGPRQLIEHGVNGLLVPAHSLEALTQGLDQLMANPAQRFALAARAPDVRQRFAADDVLQRWCAVLGV